MDSIQAAKVLKEADLIYSAEQVNAALDKMAQDINLQLADKDPLIYCVMNGGVIPAGLLLPRFSFPFRMDYLHATRYREKTSGSDLKWLKKSDLDMRDRYVLIIDDILDEGYTLEAIADYCRSEGARKVMTAVVLDKNHSRGSDFKADFVGLRVIDRYLFGMGMDYKGYLRHLPAIYAVKGM